MQSATTPIRLMVLRSRSRSAVCDQISFLLSSVVRLVVRAAELLVARLPVVVSKLAVPVAAVSAEVVSPLKMFEQRLIPLTQYLKGFPIPITWSNGHEPLISLMAFRYADDSRLLFTCIVLLFLGCVQKLLPDPISTKVWSFVSYLRHVSRAYFA